MALLSVFSLTFVACGGDDADTHKPNKTPKAAFEVEINTLTYNTVNFTVTPRDMEADYLCMLYDAATVEDFPRDTYLISTLYQQLEGEARKVGKTLTEYMVDYLDKGVLTDELTGLVPETEYYILVVGVDVANNCETTTELIKHKFATKAAPVLEVTFDIQTTVEYNTAKFVVTPSDDKAYWYFYPVPTDVYDAYQTPEYGSMTPESFLLWCVQRQIDQYRQAGYTDNSILAELFHQGTKTLSVKDLKPNTSYTNMVAGFVIDENKNINLATDVTTTTFKTGDAKPIDLTFDISVTNIEATKASIKVTPSNLQQKFFWLVDEWDGESTVQEIIDAIYPSYAGMWDAGWGLYSGVQDYTGNPGSPYKMPLESPDTDYFVIAVGYTPGVGFVGTPAMYTFHTLPAADPAETTFSVSVDKPSISPYGFKLDITSSDSSTYYLVGITTPDLYNAEEAESLLNTAIEDAKAYYEGSDYSLAQIMYMSCYRGSRSIVFNELDAATEYMVYIGAYDTKTGKAVKIHTFDNVATTKSFGEIVPTIEYVKYYSGTDEDGAVFGQPSVTNGRAITVIKYGNVDNARALFANMSEGDTTNLNEYSDAYLWSLVSEWDSVSTTQPYSFYVTDWNVEQTLIAYAVDQNSNPGALARQITTATAANKSDIQELIDLVAELNAASQSATRFSLPQSLVIK